MAQREKSLSGPNYLRIPHQGDTSCQGPTSFDRQTSQRDLQVSYAACTIRTCESWIPFFNAFFPDRTRARVWTPRWWPPKNRMAQRFLSLSQISYRADC